jgi:hypothetical protein
LYAKAALKILAGMNTLSYDNKRYFYEFLENDCSVSFGDGRLAKRDRSAAGEDLWTGFAIWVHLSELNCCSRGVDSALELVPQDWCTGRVSALGGGDAADQSDHKPVEA